MKDVHSVNRESAIVFLSLPGRGSREGISSRIVEERVLETRRGNSSSLPVEDIRREGVSEMSNCCSCIRDCTADTYQPLSSQRFGCSRGKVQRDGREAVRSPRNQRRKLSVRYDAVRPARAARLDNVRLTTDAGIVRLRISRVGLGFRENWLGNIGNVSSYILKILFITWSNCCLCLREKDFDPCF